MYKEKKYLNTFWTFNDYFLLPDLDEEQNQSGGIGRHSTSYAKEVCQRSGWY